jgi:hypothetical protein
MTYPAFGEAPLKPETKPDSVLRISFQPKSMILMVAAGGFEPPTKGL